MVISLLTLISSVYAADDGNTNWAQKLVDAIKARDSVIPNINAFVSGINDQSIKNLITALETFPSQLEGLDSLALTSEEQDGALATEIKDQQDTSLVTNRFSSSNLETYYKDRGFGFVLKTLKNALSPSQSFTGSDLPLTQMCATVQEDIDREDKYTFSTDKICRNVNRCAGRRTPYPYGDTEGTNTQEACTGDNNACDISQAIPMMAALLWYKVSDFMAQAFCYNHLKEPQKSIIQTEYKDIENMANMISAFASTLDWRQFF